MWSYGFYVILSGCGAFPPETARDRSCFAVYTYSGSLVWWRAPPRSAVKLESVDKTIRHQIRILLSGERPVRHRGQFELKKYLRTPHPRSVVLGGAADSAVLSKVSRSTSRVRCSRALHVASAVLSTSHPRSVVLGCSRARSQRALLDLA